MSLNRAIPGLGLDAPVTDTMKRRAEKRAAEQTAPSGGFPLTAEQAAVVEASATGGNVVVEALAGTGKTTTCREVAQVQKSQGRKGYYLAFNRSIVDEVSGSMPNNVTVKTVHGLAYNLGWGSRYRDRIFNTDKIPAWKMAKELRIRRPIRVDVTQGFHTTLRETTLARLAYDTVQAFTDSAQDEIGPEHVPWIDNIDVAGKAVNNRKLRPQIVAWAQRMWEEMTTNLDRPCRYNTAYFHGLYAKTWMLTDPQLGSDFVLLDEGQDSSGATLRLVQCQQGSQLITVGDSRQSIYDFRLGGVTNALAETVAEHRLSLTTSFRFGPEVAAAANEVLYQLESPDLIDGKGRPGVVDYDGKQRDSDVDALLCRTNARVVGTSLELIEEGHKVNVQGGTTNFVWFAEDAEQLMMDQGPSVFPAAAEYGTWEDLADALEGEQVPDPLVDPLRRLLNRKQTAKRKSGPPPHPDLAGFGSWGQVEKAIEVGIADRDLEMMVGLVKRFGAARMSALLDQAVPSHQAHLADLTVSTAHKAKGSEWDRVRLADDFPVWDEDPAAGELRLLYVAATRAKAYLDVSQVDYEPWSFGAPKVQR